MHENWVKVYTTNPQLASIIEGMLQQNGIKSVILNQQDSMYVSLGNAEVFVERDDAIKAKMLIEEFNR